jgi:hypothetical protein
VLNGGVKLGARHQAQGIRGEKGGQIFRFDNFRSGDGDIHKYINYSTRDAKENDQFSYCFI